MSEGVWLKTLSWFEAKSRFDAGAAELMPQPQRCLQLPRLATVDKGKAILDAMVNELVAGLRASFPEALAAGRN
jgi:hypothetical protein